MKCKADACAVNERSQEFSVAELVVFFSTVYTRSYCFVYLFFYKGHMGTKEKALPSMCYSGEKECSTLTLKIADRSWLLIYFSQNSILHHCFNIFSAYSHSRGWNSNAGECSFVAQHKGAVQS